MIDHRERSNKADNRQNQNKEINRNCRKEMQQKKPPSHKFIKKTARKKSINNISLSYRYTFLQLLDLQRKKR